MGKFDRGNEVVVEKEPFNANEFFARGLDGDRQKEAGGLALKKAFEINGSKEKDVIIQSARDKSLTLSLGVSAADEVIQETNDVGKKFEEQLNIAATRTQYLRNIRSAKAGELTERDYAQLDLVQRNTIEGLWVVGSLLDEKLPLLAINNSGNPLATYSEAEIQTVKDQVFAVINMAGARAAQPIEEREQYHSSFTHLLEEINKDAMKLSELAAKKASPKVRKVPNDKETGQLVVECVSKIFEASRESSNLERTGPVSPGTIESLRNAGEKAIRGADKYADLAIMDLITPEKAKPAPYLYPEASTVLGNGSIHDLNIADHAYGVYQLAEHHIPPRDKSLTIANTRYNGMIEMLVDPEKGLAKKTSLMLGVLTPNLRENAKQHLVNPKNYDEDALLLSQLVAVVDIIDTTGATPIEQMREFLKQPKLTEAEQALLNAAAALNKQLSSIIGNESPDNAALLEASGAFAQGIRLVSLCRENGLTELIPAGHQNLLDADRKRHGGNSKSGGIEYFVPTITPNTLYGKVLKETRENARVASELEKQKRDNELNAVFAETNKQFLADQEARKKLQETKLREEEEELRRSLFGSMYPYKLSGETEPETIFNTVIGKFVTPELDAELNLAEVEHKKVMSEIAKEEEKLALRKAIAESDWVKKRNAAIDANQRRIEAGREAQSKTESPAAETTVTPEHET